MTQKRISSWTKYAAAFIVACCFLVLSSCKDDSEPAPTMTISETIASEAFKQSATVSADVALDSLNKYINLYPDLQALITGTTEYTLFAPSNTAFINLLATPGFPSNIALINPDIIKGVLSYHFVAGTKLQAELTSGTELTTLYTDAATTTVQKITINADGTLKTGSSNQSIAITKADTKTTNGVVHVTGSVLIPPSVGATLTPILGTIAGTILLGKDFTNLAKVIMSADAGFTEDAGTLKFKLSTWLAMPINSSSKATANLKGLTFLAPPNKAGTTDVLTEAIANSLIASADKGRSFVLNHLITSKQYTVADPPANNPNEIGKFTDGQTITPASGTSKNITVSVSTPSASNPYGVALSNTPGTVTSFRPIVSKDIAHSNGTLQVFAGALQ